MGFRVIPPEQTQYAVCFISLNVTNMAAMTIFVLWATIQAFVFKASSKILKLNLEEPHYNKMAINENKRIEKERYK
jgi:hypothetical protein